VESGQIFIDWITVSQHHFEGGLPFITDGVTVSYNSTGVPVFERNKSTSVLGSYETGVRVGCDGFRVALSGNPGRFSRKDNVFNHGIAGTIIACNRILAELALPPFTNGNDGQAGFSGASTLNHTRRGAVVSRLDVTCNYKTGSETSARAFIRWLAGRSVSRMKRGQAGDESVWWANTRHMLKAYIKHIEMIKHGTRDDDRMYQWLKTQGVVRVEIELKRRLLQELGLKDLGNITDAKLTEIYESQIEPFKRADRSSDSELLEALPYKSRLYAAAWLAGEDMRTLLSSATLYRHAKILREHGIDILAARNVERFPVQVRYIDLEPLCMPDWYELDDKKIA
jgi:hypothetical protein